MVGSDDYNIYCIAKGLEVTCKTYRVMRVLPWLDEGLLPWMSDPTTLRSWEYVSLDHVWKAGSGLSALKEAAMSIDVGLSWSEIKTFTPSESYAGVGIKKITVLNHSQLRLEFLWLDKPRPWNVCADFYLDGFGENDNILS